MANKFDVDADLVRKLAELLGETDLSEIEYESTGRRIRVARQIGGAPVVSVSGPAAGTAPQSAAADPGDTSAQRKGTPIYHRWWARCLRRPNPVPNRLFASETP